MKLYGGSARSSARSSVYRGSARGSVYGGSARSSAYEGFARSHYQSAYPPYLRTYYWLYYYPPSFPRGPLVDPEDLMS